MPVIFLLLLCLPSTRGSLRSAAGQTFGNLSVKSLVSGATHHLGISVQASSCLFHGVWAGSRSSGVNMPNPHLLQSPETARNPKAAFKRDAISPSIDELLCREGRRVGVTSRD